MDSMAWNDSYCSRFDSFYYKINKAGKIEDYQLDVIHVNMLKVLKLDREYIVCCILKI